MEDQVFVIFSSFLPLSSGLLFVITRCPFMASILLLFHIVLLSPLVPLFPLFAVFVR